MPTKSDTVVSEDRVHVERYLAYSAKIETNDLDWSLAKQVGLIDSERFILTYFSDIEGQTIFYLRDLLNTKASLDPEVTAFLTIWNYEEFFHGQVLAKLLGECGTPLGKDRLAIVHKTSKFSEKMEAWGARLLSKVVPDHFLSLYMTWGAINELTTLCGYEQLQSSTRNPILQILCERIVKQERRHFAWYFNSARDRLAASRTVQQFTRKMLHLFWTPVGAGVKKTDEVARLITTLFPGSRGNAFAEEIDSKITTLPGLQGLPLMSRYLKKAIQAVFCTSPVQLTNG